SATSGSCRQPLLGDKRKGLRRSGWVSGAPDPGLNALMLPASELAGHDCVGDESIGPVRVDRTEMHDPPSGCERSARPETGEYEGRPKRGRDTCIVGIAVLDANAVDGLRFVP